MKRTDTAADQETEAEVQHEMLVSIIIPCYRSEKTIGPVVEEIDRVFRNQEGFDYELILVNDGSPDNTYSVIRQICGENSRVTGIDLSRNFGQSNARMAGVKYIHGEILITMDDDGQHPADGIFRLIDKIREGYDLVYARFPKKKHSMFKRFSSWLNGVIMTLLGQKENDLKLSTFAAYGPFAVKAIKNNNCPVPATGSYIRRISRRIGNVDMEHRERLAGKSNYSIRRMFLKWEKGLTGFSTKALAAVLRLGAMVTAGSFLFAFITFVRKLIHPKIQLGYTSLMIVILMCSGIIMMMLGVLGEYIGQVYMVLMRMPSFMIREEVLSRYGGKEEEKDLES